MAVSACTAGSTLLSTSSPVACRVERIAAVGSRAAIRLEARLACVCIRGGQRARYPDRPVSSVTSPAESPVITATSSLPLIVIETWWLVLSMLMR